MPLTADTPFTDQDLKLLTTEIFDTGRSNHHVETLIGNIQTAMVDGDILKCHDLAAHIRSLLPPVPHRVLAALRSTGLSQSQARRIIRSCRSFGGETRAIKNAFKRRHSIDTSDIPEQGADFFANAKQTRLPVDTKATIAKQNDRFRAAMGSTGTLKGSSVVTASIAALGFDFRLAVTRMVRDFTDFKPENDPHGEHDFGAFMFLNQRINWKIDYYDSEACEYGSEAPHDATRTFRIITIMLASDN